MQKRIIALFTVLSLLLIMGSTASAQGNRLPLPAVPASSVLDIVRTQSGGPVYTPLTVPTAVLNQLSTFSGVFTNAPSMFSITQAVSYIDTQGTLLESVLPLANSAAARLTPDITTPGRRSEPGKIVGALFQPARGSQSVQIVVVIFQNNRPHRLRFYYDSTNYNETNLKHGTFTDLDGNGVVEPGDEGAVISHNLSCVTVGLEQVCWDPHNRDAVRERHLPRNIARDAEQRSRQIYDHGVNFYTNDALPDLIGPSVRAGCAAQIAAATSFSNLSACRPNLVFTASREAIPGQPIGLFVVSAPADLRAYRTDGTFVGSLPAGEYLLIDATPEVNTPGAIGVLFLVNLDTVNHYLIPSMVVQGFGQSSLWTHDYAAIKDGLCRWRAF